MSRGKPQVRWAENCRLAVRQRTLRLPVLFDGSRCPVLVPSNWFRYLAVDRRIPESTLDQTVNTIRNFWEFLEDSGNEWNLVSDDVLKAWRERDLTDGLERKTCNEKLGFVYRFYVWAQEHGYLSGQIGVPDLANSHRPPISITFSTKTSRKGRKAIKSELLLAVPKKPRKYAPTGSQMDRAYLEISQKHSFELAVRNSVILTWAELTGLREMEIAGLRCCQIPEEKKIRELVETNQPWEIIVVGKGGKERRLPILPELLSATDEYQKGERQQVLERLGVDSPSAIFISHTKGTPLKENSISNIFSKVFHDAGVQSTLHRVRARYLQRLAEICLEEEVDRVGIDFSRQSVILRLAELAGHSSTSTTLGFYVDLAAKRYVNNASQERLDKEETNLALDRLIQHKRIRLDFMSELLVLSKTLRSGDREAMKLTRRRIDAALDAMQAAK